MFCLQVLAAMREAARQDAETAQEQLEELQAHAPDRIQEAYRRGTYCSCGMSFCLVRTLKCAILAYVQGRNKGKKSLTR
jgi:hypothetical protein